MSNRITFSLFPFVSILLCMMGVLTFLTIAIVLLSPKMDDLTNENPYNVIYEKKDPKSETWLIEYKQNNISILKWDEKINRKRNISCNARGKNEGCRKFFRFLKKIALKNKGENKKLAKYDQFLFLVHPSGVKNYIFFKRFLNLNKFSNFFSGNIKYGLVLLEENEEYKK
jgi:hypothetical protein